jgi:PAS domain S-box-containing protein
MRSTSQLETKTATTPLRILLVEDSEDDAYLLTRYLERSGYAPVIRRVETAEAMQTELRQNDLDWDVVLADFNLPTFSAPAALHLLKRMGRDLPFIIMSGAVSEETAVQAMRAGAHDYVSKQNLARLVPAIEREIREARARRLKCDTEQALRISEERFLRLARAMPVGLVIAEPDGIVRYANTAIERTLGYSEQELRSGAVDFRSIFEQDASAVLLRLRSAVAAAEPRRPFEALCRTRSNERVPVLLALAPLAPEDVADGTSSPEQIAIFFIDLSDQKRSEEVLRRTEKLAATGRLAASIAHEINNPLEAVTNCLFLIGSGPLDPRSKEYLHMAQRELDRVTHIATQTLRFYRQSSKPVDADMNDLLDSVVALYEPRLRTYAIRIQRQYQPVPPVRVYDGEIRQVLANLVGNAIDAMQRDGGRLILRTAPGRDPHSTPGVYVTVADTGIGMDKSTRSRIFEPFFSTKGLTGTGLGLWVSQTIVEKHGGRASISSRVRTEQNGPGGTVFRIFLPLQSALPAATHSTW